MRGFDEQRFAGGENLGFTFGHRNPAMGAVKGWLQSPDNKKNLLDEEFVLCGVGF